MKQTNQWDRFNKYCINFNELCMWFDISRMDFDDRFLSDMEPNARQACAAMAELEKGATANPDEGRMVGHYWLRNAERAPSDDLKREITDTVAAVKKFAAEIHAGRTAAANGQPFDRLLVIGIGGSALGPQFVADALMSPNDRMSPWFLDNTDPDGMDRVFSQIGSALATTLAIVISKSGSTKETRNGMLEAQAAYKNAGLDFSRHAVAVTGAGSELDRLASAEGWIARFPMWDWVGGRTSVTSAVGLLPAALQGIDIDALLTGAAVCDDVTRRTDTMANPALLMALMWHHATSGRGQKDLVMLPYKDRLLLFSRYLQQLIMESIGKEFDLAGNVVNQGLTVYGNKGSTDQHAYVQQLREGVLNFFVTFIEVLEDRAGISMEVEQGITSGDYLFGFLRGTRQALHEKGRQSMTITVERIDARTIGMLIALFERTVGLYASLVGINAYHQPGVEAGKKAAGAVIELQLQLTEVLAKSKKPMTAMDVSELLGRERDVEDIFAILRHLAANGDRGVLATPAERACDMTFSMADI